MRHLAAGVALCSVAAMTNGLEGANQPEAATIIPSVSIRPGDIAVGSDGNLWFPEMGTNLLGRLTTSGLLAEFEVYGALVLGRSILAGPDGKVWLFGFDPDENTRVWAVDTSGASTQVGSLFDRRPFGIDFFPVSMAAGPDQNVWIAEYFEIVRLSPDGASASFPISGDVIASSITAGPDGNLWFVDSAGPFAARRQELRRVSTQGVIELVSSATSGAVSSPTSIISGSDGTLWFADSGFGEIVRVSLQPLAMTHFAFAGAFRLAAGADGNIWATVPGRGTIARMTPEGISTEFELPTPRSVPSAIAAGPDGNLWFTEPDNGTLGRITPAGEITEYALRSTSRAPVQKPVSAPRSTRGVSPR